jgi:hypothetical protein
LALYRRRRKPVNPEDRAIFNFNKLAENASDEMRVYTVLSGGQPVYQRVMMPREKSPVSVSLALNPAANVRFTEEWRDYWPTDLAIDREAAFAETLIRAVLELVAMGYDQRVEDPNLDAACEYAQERFKDAACEFAAELRGFTHMPKYLPDDVCMRVAKELGMPGPQPLRRIWRLVRKEMKLNATGK